MAVTQAQKVDFLLKKIGFTKTKTGLAVDETLSGTKKAGFAEAIPSPLIIANDSLWNESSLIPTTPPGSDTSQVKVYLASSSGHQMTVDSTVAGNRAFIAFSTYNNTSSARLNNWIDTQFGSSYLIKVFRGDPNSGGVQLSAAGSGNNDGWFFDYSAGVLNFNDTNVPSGVTSSNIYIVGYRYIGLTGAPTPTGAGNFTFNNLTVTSDLDVDGHTNLDNVSIAGVVTATTFVGDGDFFDLDVDGHTNLDNVNVAGVSTFSKDIIVNGLTVGKGANSASNNTVLGTDALDGAVSGANNTAVGAFALTSNTSGERNTAMGSGALMQVETGQQNTALGRRAMRYTTASDNTAVGADALFSNNSGQQNTTAGTLAGSNLVSGSNNLILGYNAQATATNTSNEITLGNSSITHLRVPGIGVSFSEGGGFISGIVTATELDISGDIDVDGHTNLDNVSIAGVTTVTGMLQIPDGGGSSNRISVGDSEDLKIYHTGNESVIKQDGTGDLIIDALASGADIRLRSEAQFQVQVGGSTHIQVYKNGGVSLHQAGTGAGKKLETLTTGARVTGTLDVTDGITVAGNIDANGDLDVDGHTNLDNVSIAGVTSVASLTSGRVVLAGTGGKLEDSNKLTFDGTTLGLTGDANFTGNLTVGGVLTYEDVKNVDSVGLITARSGIRVTGGVIEAQAGENKIPSLYSAMTNLPAAGSYHGMFAHVHATGRGYFAHAGNWLELVNKETNGTVGTGTETYNIGTLNLKDLDVDQDTNLDNVNITGVTTFTGNINVGIAATVGFGSHVDLPKSARLRFGGGASGAGGLQIFNHNSGTQDYSFVTSYDTLFLSTVAGPTITLSNQGTKYLSLAGADSFYVKTSSTGTNAKILETDTQKVKLNYIGNTKLETSDKGIVVGTGVTIETNGQATFTGIVTASSFRGDGSQLTGISVDATALKDSNGNVKIQAQASGAVHVGIATFQDLDVDGHTNLDNVSVAGVTTFSNDISLIDDKKATFGNNVNDLYIEHKNGGQSVISHSGSDDFWIGGRPNGYINITPGYSNTYSARFQLVGNLPGGAKTPAKVELWYGASGTSTPHEKKLETTGYGVTVYGTTQTQQLNVVGVSTFQGGDVDFIGSNHNIRLDQSASALKFFTDAKAHFGTGNDLQIYHNSNENYIKVVNTQELIFGTDNTNRAMFESGGHFRPFVDSTYDLGVNATRWRNVYADTYYGDGSNLTGIVAGITTINGVVNIANDLDVDGHTNLDNVSVAGVTTFSGGSVTINPSGANHSTLTIKSQESNSTAGPILNLLRDDGAPQNQDYLGIIKFNGSNSTGQQIDYAKITGKILDVSNSAEDGILEFEHVKNGFQTVTGRFRSDSFQLLNGTNFSVAGNSTFTGTAEFDSDAKFDSTITAGGATGNNGQYLKSTGSGVAWESFPTMRTTTTVTASAGQTTFSFTYNIGFLDVFVNGVKLTASEFTATNGSSVVLSVGCFVGDIVELVSYNTVSGGGGGGGGSSITVQDEGSTLTTDATTLNFVGTGIVASGTGATKTITVNAGTADTSNVTTNNLNVVGFSTFARTVLMKEHQRINFRDANTAIFHQTNFNIESSGSGGHIILKTNASGGDANDVVLHGGSVGELLRAHGTGDVDIINTLGIGGSITKASGQLDIRADNLQLKNAASGATYASFTNGGAVELNHNNTKRLETTSNGVNIIGSLFVNGSGIGGGGGSGFFSQTVAGIHTLSKVGIGTADPEFDLDLGSYTSQNVSTASTIRIMGDGASSANTAIRFGAGGNNVDYTLLRVDGQDGTTDGDGNTDLGFALRYMSAGESGTDNRIAFWADNTNKTKYEALSIYNDGRVLVDNGAGGGHGFYGHPDDHFTVRGSSGFDNVRVVGVSTFQNVLPQTDSTYDIGTNTVRFRNIYADTLYGDGSNLTGISGGGGTDVGITTNLSGSFSATPGSPTTINTLSGYSSDDLVVEYTIYIKNGSNIQTQKLLAMRDGTTIDSTQFAVMFSSSLLAQFDATISSGNILLRATPESGITGTTDYKIKREVM